MAIPGRAVGGGSSLGKNVFKITFTRPLASKVTYEAYDNDQTFPDTDTQTTTDNDVFGLGAGEDPMVALRDTTNGTSTGTSWFPDTAQSNTSTINFLKGTTYYVTQQGATVSAGGSITFNMQCKVPASTQTDSTLGFNLTIRYSYISTTPTVNYYFNSDDGGTDATPSWAELTPGTHGFVHTRLNTATAGPYYVDIPATGQTKTSSIWIVASL